MTKKIAVIVRDRQIEALRMSIGLTLVDDEIDLFVLNRKLEQSEQTALNNETTQDMEMKIFSNIEQGEPVQYLAGQEMANTLLTYDHILPY